MHKNHPNSKVMEAICSCSHLLLISFLLFSPGAIAAGVTDTISKGRNVTDGEVLVSAGGTFTLGFFSPGVSTKRYLGIWFSVSSDAVCWVANGGLPVNGNSGVLVVSATGSLLLLDGSGKAAWSSNSTTSSSAAAQLLDSGNLVVRDRGSATILWQSFDHPSNTLLSGMKLGKNLWTGAEWYLTAWRAADDPSPGAYRRVLDTGGLPDLVVWQGGAAATKTYRTGPWNGRWFSGVPEVSSYADLVTFQVTTTSPGEISYGYVAKPGAPPTRVVVTEAGVAKRLVWDASRRAWQTFFTGPRDVCDAYGRCGAFGLCDAGAAAAAFCGCLPGFSPASPPAWSMRDTSGGCRRNVALECGGGGGGGGNGTATTDGFVVVRGVKLPDTDNATVDMGATLEQCRARCLGNCSCLAYAAADIRGGDVPSGCVIWTGVVDLRYVDQGQDLYLRLAKSELPPAPAPPSRPFPTAIVVGASTAGVAVLIVLLVLVVIRRRRRPAISAAHGTQPSSPPTTVPSVELSNLKTATGDFSESNIIGRGGFSVVYEGHLPDGKKVAVKRLIRSILADQGSEAFMREVRVMSKLKHTNLVQLLYYCEDGDERILVYEFMKNRSLNLYIFGRDPRLRALLNWERRLEIIRGVAKGVAYLHGLSEEVIHRDLKPSNVLLDDNWRPKIADFGTAKPFVVDQTDPTLVQTAGYTAPEYATERHLTLKCDIYSFGVVLLETISGERNRTTPMLLNNAWESWNQRKVNELLDSAVAQPEPELLYELERCVQIGLLCVQQSPEERPTMSAVVAMLNNYNSTIRPPKRPIVDSKTGSPFREANPSTQEASSSHRAPNLTGEDI
ncbi:hypothetical protein ACP4OV_025685 [Aristida adscensionis]